MSNSVFCPACDVKDKRAEHMSRELSRLRELVKEVRDKMEAIHSDFEFCKASGDAYGDRSASYAETAGAAVAKIDATIKEIDRE